MAKVKGFVIDGVVKNENFEFNAGGIKLVCIYLSWTSCFYFTMKFFLVKYKCMSYVYKVTIVNHIAVLHQGSRSA